MSSVNPANLWCLAGESEGIIIGSSHQTRKRSIGAELGGGGGLLAFDTLIVVQIFFYKKQKHSQLS
jgi:hypothetical protein